MPATPILALPYPSPDDNVDVPRDIQALAEAVEAHGGLIIGEVRFIAVSVAPPGFLLADGRAVSRTTYDDLFAAIGAGYGAGDGSTTFNLPAVAGRALVGAGAGAGLTNHPAGEKFGDEALSVAQMPSHNHGGNTGNDAPDHTHGYTTWIAFTAGTAGAYGNMLTGSVGAQTGGASTRHTHPINGQGGGQAHWQPSLAVPAYIYAGA